MKVLDNSVSEEEWRGVNFLEVGLVFLGKKGKAGIAGQGKSTNRQEQKCVKVCKSRGRHGSWVMPDPWLSVVMAGDARGCFNLGF